MSRSTEQWLQFARQRHRYFFFYEDRVLDLTDFIHLHPGGKKALINYVNKDITDILFKVYPHKKEQTLKVINQYTVGTVSDKGPRKGMEKKGEREREGQGQGEPPKEKKKVCFHRKFICDDENDGHTDDSDMTFSRKKDKSKKKSNLKPKIGKSKDSPLKSSSKSHSSKSSKSSKSLKSIQSVKTFEEDLRYDCSLNPAQEQLDEQKPTFLVPILQVKHMNEL